MHIYYKVKIALQENKNGNKKFDKHVNNCYYLLFYTFQMKKIITRRSLFFSNSSKLLFHNPQ